MQHSTMTWRETQQLIKVVAEAGCIPFVRVPSANIGDILKACDAGALGIVVPMVESVEEARCSLVFQISDRLEQLRESTWSLERDFLVVL